MNIDTWSQGQLAVHDHVIQVFLLEIVYFASKLPTLLAWQHHWPTNLPANSKHTNVCLRAIHDSALACFLTTLL